MNILLDTHIALWALNDDPALSEKARTLISDPDNTVYYSTVSTWEILLKHERQPDNVELSASDFVGYCREAGFIPLGLYDKHIEAVATLKLPGDAPKHNDPFDRLLLAQAKAENLSFLTHDAKIPYYNERCIISV